MAGEDTHYEVFCKKNKKASWTLVEALPQRQDAMDLANGLVKKNPKASVRIVREVWSAAEGKFRGGAIFENGPERFAAPEEKTAEATIPCLTPDDLAGASARDTLRRALGGWLERRQVSPLELLHRPDLIEELDGSDNDLKFAIQKVAIARAQNSDASVHSYVRVITDLVQRGIVQAQKESKKGKKPPKANGFGDLVEKIAAEGGPEKRLRRAIAERLADACDAGQKTGMLLDMHDDLPADPEARALAAKQTDLFIAEMLSFDSAARRVIGETRDFGEHVERLTAIYEGAPRCGELERAPDNARRLAQKFADKSLPDSHIEVARKILDALRSPKRFRPSGVLKEIELARKLAQRLIVASGPNLHPDSLVDAFTHRSARLLAPETIEEALSTANGPVEEIERLFAMEDNIVGEKNKSKLASYIRAKLKGGRVESHFIRGPGQPLERLSTLTSLQRRAETGTFPQDDKSDLADAFDNLGLQVLDETKVLARIASSGRPALDQAEALLKLAASGILPSGRCAQDAQARAMRALSSDMGRQEAGSAEGRRRLMKIQGLLAALAPEQPPEPQAAPSDEQDGEAAPAA